jgi:ornithine carbamoyltransferase
MKHFLSINDLTAQDARFLLAEAARLKAELNGSSDRQRRLLAGQTLAMIFEKPSLRTRVSFDVGMFQLGGHAVYISPGEIGLGTRESVADVARVLARFCNGVMARVFSHDTLTEMVEYSSVPIINGLSDREHPCQALADFVTLREHCVFEGSKMAYLGDGNNVCHSLMLLAAKLGTNFSAAVPEGYEPDAEIVQQAQRDAQISGAKIEVLHDPRAAAQNADALYTDVWTSMGQEEETARRLEVFPPYQLNAELLRAAKPDAIILHCLPAHRGEEITHEMMESPQSRVFDEAENRLHAQKAVLAWCLG